MYPVRLRLFAALSAFVVALSNFASAQVVQPATPTLIDLNQITQDDQNSDNSPRRLPAIGNRTASASQPPSSALDSAPTERSDSTQEASQNAEALTLADVIASMYRSYPKIEEARSLAVQASGQYLQAYGAFDTKAHAYSLSDSLGFYENHRQGIGVARQTWWGGYLAAGYRLGRGNFAPWYLERETNKGGELKVAATQPLLRGRAIDPQRLAIFNASLARQAAAPQLLQAVLDSAKEASMFFWEWVAAGAVLQAQRELLVIAEKRGQQFQTGFKAGKFAEIDLILNQQLVAERRGKVIESQQKYQSAGFKLSLYLRDGSGNPLIPTDAWLPKCFPIIDATNLASVTENITLALAMRPETKILEFQLRQLNNEQALACNQLLPNLDVLAQASQDTGEPTSSKRDKSEFELMVGLQAEVPIQRRKARGKLQSIRGKIVQTNQKLRLQRNKIEAEVRTLRNAVDMSQQSVRQAEASLRAALDVLRRYRFAFDRGKIDLIYLNLLETKANQTEIKLVEAQRNWFINLAFLERAIGLDPVESAMRLSALPVSDRIGPGNLPPERPIDQGDFDKDWKTHSDGANP